MLLRPVEGEAGFFDETVRIVCERAFTCIKGSECFEDSLFGLARFAGIDCCLRGVFGETTFLGVIFLDPVRALGVFA